MKIKTKEMPYGDVCALPRFKHKNPRRPMLLMRKLIRILSKGDLAATQFSYTMHNMEAVGDEPCLILMNHSSFIDLKIASEIFKERPYNIVCTSDGFVGKELLMRSIGCIPTQKFVTDVHLISDIQYALKTLKTSVLMYPEASYSFDGTATALPRKMGVLLKRLGVPVVTVITSGAFLRDPLYNNLQLRKTKVSARVSCLFTKDDLKNKSTKEIDKTLDEAFSFDNFAAQYENKVEITEDFRADGLNRILYKCSSCGAEGKMEGKGTKLTCHSCGKTHMLTTLGRLQADDGETRFAHIPDWYLWEREEVKKEIESGAYLLDTQVDIGVMVDFKAIYKVGSGRLIHTKDGFKLTGCGGELNYEQGPLSCYGLYSDYYWYEIGDVICIGNNDTLYYCFPKNSGDVVAKTRMAAEEIYKSAKAKKRLNAKRTGDEGKKEEENERRE